MTVQIVEIAGQKMAMLPVADYERLIDLAEDKADIFAAFESENRRKEGVESLAQTPLLVFGRTWLRSGCH
jgi:hypothetical protein